MFRAAVPGTRPAPCRAAVAAASRPAARAAARARARRGRGRDSRRLRRRRRLRTTTPASRRRRRRRGGRGRRQGGATVDEHRGHRRRAGRGRAAEADAGRRRTRERRARAGVAGVAQGLGEAGDASGRPAEHGGAHPRPACRAQHLDGRGAGRQAARPGWRPSSSAAARAASSAGRRPPIITESEFLARRESVERVMVVRQTRRPHPDRGARGRRPRRALRRPRGQPVATVGNVYLGKVQNVLPCMEAAFVDIGKGRNARAVRRRGQLGRRRAGGPAQARSSTALKSGESVLVQVTKDPIGPQGRPADQPDLACPAATWSTCPTAR